MYGQLNSKVWQSFTVTVARVFSYLLIHGIAFRRIQSQRVAEGQQGGSNERWLGKPEGAHNMTFIISFTVTGQKHDTEI